MQPDQPALVVNLPAAAEAQAGPSPEAPGMRRRACRPGQLPAAAAANGFAQVPAAAAAGGHLLRSWPEAAAGCCCWALQVGLPCWAGVLLLLAVQPVLAWAACWSQAQLVRCPEAPRRQQVAVWEGQVRWVHPHCPQDPAQTASACTSWPQ